MLHGYRFVLPSNECDDSLDEIVWPEMKQAYEADKKNWLATEVLLLLATEEQARENPAYISLNL